jgi:hypothetical protein
MQTGKTDRLPRYIMLLYMACLDLRVKSPELKNLINAIEQKHSTDLIWDTRDYIDLLLELLFDEMGAR